MDSSYTDTQLSDIKEKEGFFRKTLRKVSRYRSSNSNKSNGGKQDYIRTNIILDTEKQAKEDDEINRKIYDQKRQLYHQIKIMIENSDVKVDFSLSNKPHPPPSPDNHTRWLRYQQAMTPQPAWMMVQAITYLINKGYLPGHDFDVDKTIDFCRQIASRNNDLEVLEYKEGDDPIPPMSPNSMVVSSLPHMTQVSVPTSRVQSLYNFGTPVVDYELQSMEVKSLVSPERPVSTYHQSEDHVFSEKLSRLQSSLSGKSLPSAPPLPNSV